jgi:hypothetical protein
MGRAKEIIVKVIPSKIANEFVKKHHYSGKVDPRCYVHFGCFLDGKLHGVMQLGPSINKTASVNLVKDTHWNGYCELARVAFDDYLPANSESRCLSIMMKLLKKQAPHIEWVVSYADGAQCGDGGIYRASGFNLVGIKKNTSMWRMPDGTTECSLVFNPSFSSDGAGQKAKRLGKIGEFKTWSSSRYLNHIGAKPIDGFQLKYIYFLNEGAKKRLTVPILPFSKIDEMGAGMYKGKKVSLKERKHAAIAQGSAPGFQSGDGVRSDLAAQLNSEVTANA